MGPAGGLHALSGDGRVIMKKLIGIGVGALLCALAATAVAASDTDVLYRVGVDANANIAYLWPTDGSWSNLTCNDNGVGTVDISTEAGRLVYKTALAAHLAQHTVKVHYAACAGDFPRIARIDSYAP